MNSHHKHLTQERWNTFPLAFQMANIGSEVGRTLQWREKRNDAYTDHAFERSLELFDLTLSDTKNKNRAREIARARELWVDYIYADNQHQSDPIFFNRYFLAFARIPSINT